MKFVLLDHSCQNVACYFTPTGTKVLPNRKIAKAKFNLSNAKLYDAAFQALTLARVNFDACPMLFPINENFCILYAESQILTRKKSWTWTNVADPLIKTYDQYVIETCIPKLKRMLIENNILVPFNEYHPTFSTTFDIDERYAIAKIVAYTHAALHSEIVAVDDVIKHTEGTNDTPIYTWVASIKAF